MKEVHLSNTLTRKKEIFLPIDEAEVKMYCCGPTVYNYAHIGNLRTYIFEDILARMFEMAGYNVRHAMNITDVGHLTSDADDGDDKMLLAAEKEQKSVNDIARKYEDKFFEDTKSLGLRRPNIVPRASEHVEDMVDFIKSLEEKGYAYAAPNGNVYFDTSKFPEYGKLSGQNREDLRHGARVEEDENKRNPSDFVLWFVSSKFKNQIMQWDSPWGKGYPGWHIECSVMAKKYLGDRIDIHCGGIDHIPVHHENEIAQSEAYLGHQWVNNWLHSEFLQIKDGKMSKSKGNFITLDTLKEKGYKPEHYKYFSLLAHYKSPLVFSYENLDSAANAYENLRKKVKSWKSDKTPVDPSRLKEYDGKLEDYMGRFDGFLFDDLKTPQAVALIWDVARDSDFPSSHRLEFIKHAEGIFNLSLGDIAEENLDEIPGDILKLAGDRKKAKEEKNWDLADEIRKEIEKTGYSVKDLPGNEFEIIRV